MKNCYKITLKILKYLIIFLILWTLYGLSNYNDDDIGASMTHEELQKREKSISIYKKLKEIGKISIKDFYDDFSYDIVCAVPPNVKSHTVLYNFLGVSYIEDMSKSWEVTNSAWLLMFYDSSKRLERGHIKYHSFSNSDIIYQKTDGVCFPKNNVYLTLNKEKTSTKKLFVELVKQN